MTDEGPSKEDDDRRPGVARPAPTARLAGAAMALSQAPWLFLILSHFRLESAAVAAWNGAVAAAILGLAAAVGLFRRARAVGPALVGCYFVLVVSAYWALQHGLRALWVSAAAAGAAVLLLNQLRETISSPARGASRPLPTSRETVGIWIRENIEAVVVAFIMALVIRCFCIEVFKIPSSSMEPTLLGDNTHEHRKSCAFREYHPTERSSGDRIMVTKFYYAASRVERFDVIVFKFPLNQARNFIKRVVGLPGEEILLREGDIFFRPRGEQAFQIARKPLRLQDALWVDLFPRQDADFETAFRQAWRSDAEGRFRLQGNEVVTLEADGRRDLRFEFLPPVQDDHGHSVRDARLAFDFELTGPRGQVFAEIANGYGRFEVRLSTHEPSVLEHHAAEHTRSAVLSDVRVSSDRRHRLELAVADGMAYVRLDGAVRGRLPFIERLEDARPGSNATRISFGSRGATFRARRFAVGRDLHYRGKSNLPEGRPLAIDDGHYVVLGDNVNASHDSRAWTRYAYVLEDGRRVECEGQEASSDFSAASEMKHKYGLPAPPDLVVKADLHGNEWALYRAPPGGPIPARAPVGIVRHEEPAEAFQQIDGRFVVGKGLWVWWPSGRWFRLIR